jgi:O-acetylserine/cysteine efflux transporter
MSSNTPLTGLERLAIAAIILTWGLNNAAAKVATAELPPMMVGALRFALALAFLLPFLKPPFPWSGDCWPSACCRGRSTSGSSTSPSAWPSR